MSYKNTEYDVMFMHVHKQHIYEAVAGAVDAGLKTAFVTPIYNRGLTKLAFGWLPGPVGNMVGEHVDARLDGAEIVTDFRWSLARLFVNYAWHRGDSRFFRAFDRWCAAGIRSGRFRARIFYVFQDYLPRTCAAAKEAGALLVAEQILNNSPKAQRRVLGSTQQVSFPVVCPEYPLDQSTNERLMGIADVVVVPSAYAREDIQEQVDAAKIWAAPYGSPELGPRPAASRAPAEGPLLIAARATSVRKGGHLLLEALISHSAEELFPGYSGQVELRMMGSLDPQFLPAVKKIHATQPRIRITDGYIPHAEVGALLARSNFFILPSLSEATSLAMLEAAAAGLPLVLTPYCGLDDFIDGVHGILIDEPTPSGIARAIRGMFLQRARWPELGRNAQTIAGARPWSDFGRRIAENLRTLLP
jgi:glycosyltransferase involved in cell wall biosynthesis